MELSEVPRRILRNGNRLTAILRLDSPPRAMALNLGSIDLAAWVGEVVIERLRRHAGLRALLENIESV